MASESSEIRSNPWGDLFTTDAVLLGVIAKTKLFLSNYPGSAITYVALFLVVPVK